MKLHAPATAPPLQLIDVNGRPVSIGSDHRRTLLCFFRDAACPFCNFRIYELTYHHKALAAMGLDIVAVFVSTPEKVKRFVVRKARPFPVVADPDSVAHDAYGIEHSFWGKLKAIVTRVPTLLKGMRFVGLHGLNTNNVMPADFLIDEDGKIVEAYYGADAGDHISFDRVEVFAAKGALKHAEATAA